jgi:hypothetical protein
MGRTQQKLLAVVAILLVGAVLLLSVEPSTTEAEPTNIVAIDPSKVESLSIDSSEGQMTATRSQDGIWTIEAPFAALGSQARFEGIVTGMNELVAMEPLDSNDYSQFGLEPPMTSVEVGQQGQPSVTIHFGDPTPVGDNRYLRVNDGPVLVALGDITENIERPFATYPADVAD